MIYTPARRPPSARKPSARARASSAVNGMRHGQGTEVWPGAATLSEGNCAFTTRPTRTRDHRARACSGQLDEYGGEGELWNCSGRYKGQFSKGRKEGNGMMQYNDGSRYECAGAARSRSVRPCARARAQASRESAPARAGRTDRARTLGRQGAAYVGSGRTAFETALER